MDGIFRLRLTHLDKGLTNLDHGFGADVDVINLVFGRRGHDKIDYLGDIEDRAIFGRDRSLFGEHDVVTSTAAVFSGIKVGSILVAREHHATNLVNGAIVSISDYIIKELEKESVGVFGGRSLLLADLVETYKGFVINGLSVI